MRGEQVDITPGPRPLHKRRLLWGAIGAVAILAIAGVFTWAWMEDQARAQAEEEAKVEAERLAQIRTAALDDAQAMTVAIDDALAASAAFDGDVQLALVYLETTAIPVRDAIADAADEFGEDAEGALTTTIETLSASLEPPVLSPESADTDPTVDDDEAGESDDGPEPVAEDPSASSATPDAADPWEITLDYVAADADSRASTLHSHYGELGPDDREAARAGIVEETARFDRVGAQFTEASTFLASHVEDVDRTIQQAVADAVEVGAATQGDVDDASDGALEDLQSAIDALAAFTEMDVATEWELRTADQPSGLVGVVAAVNDYVSATESARSSHEFNRAPEPYICYAYRWGGPHPTYCWR